MSSVYHGIRSHVFSFKQIIHKDEHCDYRNMCNELVCYKLKNDRFCEDHSSSYEEFIIDLKFHINQIKRMTTSGTMNDLVDVGAMLNIFMLKNKEKFVHFNDSLSNEVACNYLNSIMFITKHLNKYI